MLYWQSMYGLDIVLYLSSVSKHAHATILKGLNSLTTGLRWVRNKHKRHVLDFRSHNIKFMVINNLECGWLSFHFAVSEAAPLNLWWSIFMKKEKKPDPTKEHIRFFQTKEHVVNYEVWNSWISTMEQYYGCLQMNFIDIYWDFCLLSYSCVLYIWNENLTIWNSMDLEGLLFMLPQLIFHYKELYSLLFSYWNLSQ